MSMGLFVLHPILAIKRCGLTVAILLQKSERRILQQFLWRFDEFYPSFILPPDRLINSITSYHGAGQHASRNIKIGL